MAPTIIPPVQIVPPEGLDWAARYEPPPMRKRMMPITMRIMETPVSMQRTSRDYYLGGNEHDVHTGENSKPQ